MQRPTPIPYRFMEREAAMFGSPTLALIDNECKFLTNLSDNGEEDLLFDLDADVAETTSILDQHPERAAWMRQHLVDFIASCRRSHMGGDYAEPYEPINAFQEITGTWADGSL